MSNALAKRILERRRDLGLTQAQLAAQLGVRQQTVARWETGKSTPSRQTISNMAEAFGESLESWLELAGRDEQLASPRGQSARPLAGSLPLGLLAPSDFERLTHMLVQALYPAADVHRVGGTGDTQHGADITAASTSQGTLLFQCKRMAQFGPRDVRSVAAATSLAADQRVIVLSRVASPSARREAVALGWGIWDHDDIVRMLQQDLASEAARRIVDTFFPGQREQILGLRESGPWSTPEEFFAGRMDRSSAFSHVWGLAGRGVELDALVKSCTSEALFCLLVGGAGIGKTRLLLELSRRLREGSALTSVYFVEASSPVRLEDFDRLGPAHVVIIVDDVHERDDIETILAGTLRRAPHPTHVVLSTRPYGKHLVLQDLARVAGVLGAPETDLKPLESADARRLAAEVIGANQESALVERLVAVTRGCTLFTVAAGVLLKTQRLDPALLGSASSFQSAVLDRMYEDYVRSSRELPGGISCREVLQLLAASQPFDLSDAGAVVAAGEILGGVSRDIVVRAFGLIVTTGVIVQRGQRLRLQPDLLADHILIDACFDSVLGLPTGYAERVWQASPASLRRNLIVNLARIDWRLSETQAMAGSLLDVAWETLVEEFERGGIAERTDLLRLVDDIAFYQPARSLALVRWALDNRIEGEQPGIVLPLNYTDVERAASPVLRDCAYHSEHTDEACKLLFRLAKTDARPTNQYPEHPLRLLTELASYSRFKPMEFTKRVIEGALGWLEDPTTLVAFDVLDEALKWDAEDHIADGHSVKMTSYSSLRLGKTDVIGLRDRVLDGIVPQLASADISRAARAVQSVGAALSGPWGMFGRSPDDEERDVAAAEAEKWLLKLASVPGLENLDPTVLIDLREVVDRFTDSNRLGEAQAAQTVVQRLREDLDATLAEALMHGPWRRSLTRHGGEWSGEEEQKWLVDLARRLISERDSAEAAVDSLEHRLDSISQAAGQVRSTPAPFVATLVRESPETGVLILKRAAAKPESSLMPVAGVALSVLRADSAEQALDLARSLMESGARPARLQVAYAYGWGLASAPQLLGEELELVRRLAKDGDELVASNIASGFRFLAVENPKTVIDIVLEMDIGRSPGLADEVLVLFSQNEPLTVEMLDQTALDAILDQLVGCERLDEYWVGEFVGALSRVDLEAVVQLMERRIEYAEKQPVSHEYRAVPFGWDEKSPIESGGSPRRRMLLEGLRDWAIAEAESWRRDFEGPRLFAAVAGVFDDEALGVIEGGLSAAPPEAKRVADLLRQVPSGFVWSHVPWISSVLEDASRRNADLYKAVSSALYSATISGSRCGTPGQPFPRDLEQREKAREIADGLPAGSATERFYRHLQRSAEDSIRRDRDED